ncbi:hypothetical protein MACH26_22620 [Planctobacterium marinum]|uniref:Fatty acid hydroxylase domain-containing protein n=2 Tax=Planctobacterium marinum TaxID=1631968 RepID=A0AA48HHZ8_9ALTE|nr:hypothetical protein MACH26_22620 [Planctobacterium marinum]
MFSQFFKKPRQSPKDAIVEVISTSTLVLLTQPLVLFLSFTAALYAFPEWQDVLRDYPFWFLFLLFLLFDDMTQYWWHRLAHNVPLLYNLHRPHHEASYMSIRIVYRNNLFYYFLMPGIWFSGVLIYLGAGWVYAVYVVLKMTVIFAAHSDIRWDKALYKVSWLAPLMWILERLISTPSTHSAHHGKHMEDGVTHYKGNYGNLLFFWDVLFGSAKITRRYPAEYGVENMSDTSAAEQLLWPVVRDRKK